MDRIGIMKVLLRQHNHAWNCKQGLLYARKSIHRKCIHTLLTRGPQIHTGNNFKYSISYINSSSSGKPHTFGRTLNSVTKVTQRCEFNSLNGHFIVRSRAGLYNSQPCHPISASSSHSESKSDNPGDTAENANRSASSENPEWKDDKAAADERKAGIQNLLDEATGESKDTDEFDFDPESESQSDKRSQRSRRPRHDPSETSVFLFPGQGSQFVGMGQNLLKYPNVEEMYSIASEILGYDLLSLCVNGPAEELDRTIHCQPAVVVTALAAVEKLKEEQPKAIENCVAAAGFSVGEFAALVFAGAISFEDAIRVIKVRAEAMQRASEMVSSGMLSVMGGRKARYKSICNEAESYAKNHHNVGNPVCRVANYLFPDARVLAGNTEALSFIQEMSRSFYLRKVKPLPVSGAFHTPLMSSAQDPIGRALEAVAMETPVIAVHSNVDGKAYGSPKHICKQLKRQVVEPVLWEQTMHNIYEREKGMPFPLTYEMGPGNQLGAMLKRNNLKASNSYANVKV